MVTQRQRLFNWVACLLVGAMFWLCVGIAVTRADEGYIASTWTGATAPRSSTTATCRLPAAMWTFGGTGTQPPFDFGATWWTVQ